MIKYDQCECALGSSKLVFSSKCFGHFAIKERSQGIFDITHCLRDFECDVRATLFQPQVEEWYICQES